MPRVDSEEDVLINLAMVIGGAQRQEIGYRGLRNVCHDAEGQADIDKKIEECETEQRIYLQYLIDAATDLKNCKRDWTIRTYKHEPTSKDIEAAVGLAPVTQFRPRHNGKAQPNDAA